MSIIVSKFGGSSMADADGFRRVREILAASEQRRYIILSAPGKRHPTDEKVTDLLCRAHQLYASGEDADAPLREVKNRFERLTRDLSLDVDPGAFLSTLESDVRHSADRAASRGEYLCAKLFARYADLPFVDATELIRFDENGRILPSEIRRSIRRMSHRLHCAVIPGFYGSMPNGEIKTFSRGGSDITGALVAAALNAIVYENWTDVDGLMSIDPLCCPNPICHPAVSYRQMRMLAKAGAQVLHPYCLEPVCEAGVPTLLKNTFAPEKPGTYISDHVHSRVSCVCCQDGYRAVALNDLCPEAQEIALSLHAEHYQSGDGRIMLALNGKAPGEPASVITAFGLPVRLRSAAEKDFPCLAALHLEDRSQYLVKSRDKPSSMCALHALLPLLQFNAKNNDCSH